MKTLFTRIFLPAFFAGLCLFTNAQSYTIPVVFHVLHEGGKANISDAQIFDALRILNEDFNKQNADTSNVVAAFKNNIADMQITFRLASLDPNGNCTNGIERIYSSLTNFGNQSAKLHQWNPQKYLNIWTVNSLEHGLGAQSSTPADLVLHPEQDGIMILANYIGAIGSGSYFNARGLTHETGHYLGLLHLWEGNNDPGQACADGDSVVDTPPTRGSLSCNTNSDYCTPGVIENVQNFMEYSYCSRMFTNGQKARVHNYIDNYRYNLVSPANLIATGTNSPTPASCSPIADFGVNKKFVCRGMPVKFYAAAYNGKVDAWQWTFQNADISTSADSSPVVIFNAVGWQTATLTVNNGAGSSTKTRTLVYVADDSLQLPIPYYTSFNDTADFAANWTNINADDDQPFFHPVSNSAFTNSMAIVLTNFNSHVDGSYDALITPAFDLTNIAAPDTNLSFIYSYATQDSLTPPGPVDSLAVFVTTNCGTTNWINIFKKGGAALMTEGNVTSNFIPGQSAYWSQVNVPIKQQYRTDHVRFKLQIWGSRISNNFYLDDFSVGRTISGIDEYALPALSVVPNPFNSSVRISGLPDGNYSIALYDVTGSQVATYANIRTNNDQISLNLSDATTKGVYLLKITGVENATRTLKLVRQ